VLIVVYILLVAITFVAALALVTFSPIRQVRQPVRSLLLGLGSSGVASLSSIPLALFGNRVVWLCLLIYESFVKVAVNSRIEHSSNVSEQTYSRRPYF
jgi:hypothetical protein